MAAFQENPSVSQSQVRIHAIEQEIKSLSESALQICAETQDSIAQYDNVKNQLSAYVELSKSDLGEKLSERLREELASITYMGKTHPNIWLKKLEVLNQQKDQQRKLVAIQSRLRDLNYEIANHQFNLGDSSEIKDPHGTRKALEETVRKIDLAQKDWNNSGIDAKAIAALKAQEKQLVEWQRKPQLFDEEPAAIKALKKPLRAIHQMALHKTEQLSLEGHYQALNKHLNQALSVAQQVESLAKDYEPDIQGYATFLEQTQEKINAAVTVEQLLGIKESFSTWQKEHEVELQKFLQAEKSFVSAEERFIQLLGLYSPAVLRAEKNDAALADAYKKKALGPDGVQQKSKEFMRVNKAKGGLVKNQDGSMQIAKMSQTLKELSSINTAIKTKQETILARKKTADATIKKAQDFLNEALPVVTTVSLSEKARVLLDEIKAAPNLKNMLQGFESLADRLNALRVNPVTVSKLTAITQQAAIKAILAEDLSAEKKESLIQTLKVRQGELESIEQAQQQQIDEQAQGLEAYRAEAIVQVQQRMSEELPQLQENYANIQRKITEHLNSFAATPVDLNDERNRLKTVASSLSSSLLENKKLSTTIEALQKSIKKGGFTDPRLEDLFTHLQQQKQQIEKAISENNATLTNATDAQVQSSFAVLQQVQTLLDKVQEPLSQKLAEAEHLGNYYHVTMDEFVKDSAAWHELRHFAEMQLPQIQQLRQQLQALHELEQLPAPKNIEASRSLYEWQQKLLNYLQGQESKLVLVAANNFTGLLTQQQKAETLEGNDEDLHKIPQSNWLFGQSADQVAIFAAKQAGVALRVANNIDVLCNKLFKALPLHDEAFLMSKEYGDYRETFDKLGVYIKNDIFKYPDIAARTVALERWIMTLSECQKQGNYQGVYAIQQALQDPAVARLESTWAGLSATAVNIFNKTKDKEVLQKEMLERAEGMVIVPAVEIYLQPGQLAQLQAQLPPAHTEDSALQLRLAELANDPQTAAQHLYCSENYEPAGNHPARTQVLQQMGAAMWMNVEQTREINVFDVFENPRLMQFVQDHYLRFNPQASLEDFALLNRAMKEGCSKKYLKNCLKQLGVRLEPELLGKLYRIAKEEYYKTQIEDSGLRDILKDKAIQSLTAHDWFGKTTLTCIAEINEAMRQPERDIKVIRQLVATIGYALADKEALSLENSAAVAHQDAEVSALTEPANNKTSTIDKSAINGALSRYEMLLNNDFSDEALYRNAKHIEILQQEVRALEEDFKNFATTLAGVGLEAALQERVDHCLQQIAEKNNLVSHVISPLQNAVQKFSDEGQSQGMRKMIITTDLVNLAQALQCDNPATYLMLDKEKEQDLDYSPERFYQLNKNSFYYDAVIQNKGKGEDEKQLQQALAHELGRSTHADMADFLQEKKPVYIFGEANAAKQMAQQLYAAVPLEKRAELKILVNYQEEAPAARRSSVGFWKAAAQTPIKPHSDFHVEKVNNILEWQIKHSETLRFGGKK